MISPVNAQSSAGAPESTRPDCDSYVHLGKGQARQQGRQAPRLWGPISGKWLSCLVLLG
jgi:hypothetical protein